jgi:outer membrane lipoprotein-sorting protein
MVSGPVRFTAERGLKMRNAFFAFGLFWVLFQWCPGWGSDDLSRILKGIQEKYGDAPGLTVPYSREVITRSMSMLGNQVKGDLAAGTIYFKPPYFLRLEQKSPEVELIVANEDKLWWYIPKEKRVYEYPPKAFGKELRLLSDIFRGLTDVYERFHVNMTGLTKQGQYEIELRPNPPWQEIDRITLLVTAGYDIREVNIHNQFGSITRFRLEGVTVKERFDKDFFQFVVPEGVERVKEGEAR